MEPPWGWGGLPRIPSLSHSLSSLLPLSRPGVVPQQVREWERTGKKTLWNNITTLPRASCLPSLCHFLFEVCNFLTNQTSARVPVSFMAGRMLCCETFQLHLSYFTHVLYTKNDLQGLKIPAHLCPLVRILFNKYSGII